MTGVKSGGAFGEQSALFGQVWYTLQGMVPLRNGAVLEAPNEEKLTASDSTVPQTPPPTVLQTAANFSGHETFAFRYTWLKKGVDALDADPDIFRSERAIVTLGVGKNMVSSIRHWCLATGVFEEATVPGLRIKPLSVSKFGRKMFTDNTGWDPFLEDNASLWLLHWNLATNRSRATTWYWAFNLLRDQEFTREGLADALGKQIESRGWGSASASTLKNDISCFIRTYAAGRRGITSTPEETLDCPLATLNLIVATDQSGTRLRFNNKAKPTLPVAAFCYALIDYWDRCHPTQKTLSMREIAHGEGAPGRIFRLDDDAILGYLDALASLTGDLMRFEDTAIVRQVARYGRVDGYKILDAYY